MMHEAFISSKEGVAASAFYPRKNFLVELPHVVVYLIVNISYITIYI